MKVSVALCTWNGERFLPQQLRSLLAQTRLPDEIVISDDVSSDGTMALLEAFAEEAAGHGVHVDLRRNPVNLGYAENFGSTLARASGDVVFLCDQDDVWHPEKIARMCAEFAARPELGLLHTDARLIDADGIDMGCGLFEALEMTRGEIEAEHAGHGFDVLLRRNTVTGATAAIRRDLLAGALPVPAGWVHDEWLALSVCNVAKVDCLEWDSIGYRQHGGNQIGIRKRSAAEKIAPAKVIKREYMRGVVDRLQRFLDRHAVARAVLSAEQRAEIEARMAHARFRASLPRRLVERVPAVWGELRTGNYGRYSSGLRSILSDLLDMN